MRRPQGHAGSSPAPGIKTKLFMSRKVFEDPTIKAWQDTIEPAPKGARKLLVFESEDRSIRKKIEYDPDKKIFRFLSVDSTDGANNYNSGWLERNRAIETLQKILPDQDYSKVLDFIHTQEPDTED